MENQTNYKAQFCRLFFTQLKSFIPKFDVKRNNLGMEFLTLVDERQSFWWDNTINMTDKDLMLAIEEYFHITDKSDTLQGQRETLFSALIDSDKYATDKNVKICFVDDATLKAILNYFGLTGGNERFIRDYIKDFENFAGDAASRYSLSFANYNKALRLFEFHRNNNAHNIIKQEVPKRKIAFQYLAFTYIGLVYLLRSAWSKRPKQLTKYKKPAEFSIPKQFLHVVINRQDSTNDYITGYEFVPNMDENNERITEHVNPTPRLEITVPVRKYDKFKLIVRYGTADNNAVNITFGDKEEEMLTYYYWNPTLNINLPSSSNILPGLSIGSNSTEELIAKLLDNVNKQQEGKAKEVVSDIVENLLSELEPTLQRIKELSENPKKTSIDKDKCKELIQNVDSALQKQLHKNEENFQNVLNKIDKLDKSQTTEFHKQAHKAEEHYKDLKNDIRVLTDQINKEKQDTLSKDKTEFWWKKHLPHYIIVFCAIALFIYSLMFDLSLNWLQNTWLWIIIPIILLGGGCLWTFYVYRTTVSNRHSIIKPQTKWVSIGFLVAAFIFTALAIAAIPNKTVLSLAANYDFSAEHEEGENSISARIMEDYLRSEPSDDEDVRIQLTNFYLNFANNREKAIEITKPMRDDIIKYKKGALYAAEALFTEGRDKRRDREAYNIIKNYRNTYANIPAVIYRIEGFMYCYNDQYSDKNIKQGIDLLQKAANWLDDKKAQYYLAHIYSHIMEDWSWNPQDTYFNLIDAISYYRKAATKEPKAAIELGSLYADLNVNDSAKHYFQKAISMSDGLLKLEATYRMGVLLEKNGLKNNKYISEAIDDDFAPALLYDAIKNCNHQQAIEHYESMGKYEGYCYIPPIVFEYILKGDKTKALDILNSTRENGLFNDEFVEGISLMLNKDVNDSIKGLELMHTSGIKGCKYANLIWYYRKMEKEIKENNYSLSDIDILDNLGKSDIPFANVLVANLLAKKAFYLDSINDTKHAKLLYQAAADKAIKAIELGHPAGIVPFFDSRLVDFFLSHSSKKLGKVACTSDLSFVHLILRMAPSTIKKWCLMSGWGLDYQLNKELTEYFNGNGQKKLRNTLPEDHRHFWYDVTLANSYTPLLLEMLYYDFNDNIDYTTRLFCKVFDNIANPDEMTKKILSFKVRTMDTRFHHFIDSLKNVYKSDPLKINILNGAFTLKYGEKVSFTYTSTLTIHDIDNISILNEYSDKDFIYDMPL